MWIGRMSDCPLDLSAQGSLLRHGAVEAREEGRAGAGRGKLRRWSAGGGVVRHSPSHLFLFQQALVLCRAGPGGGPAPPLTYSTHLRFRPDISCLCFTKPDGRQYFWTVPSLNQLRVRDTVAGEAGDWEVHRLEAACVGVGIAVVGEVTAAARPGRVMRLRCRDEQDKQDWVSAINKEVRFAN